MTLVSSSSIRLPAGIQEFSLSIELHLRITVCNIAWERGVLFSASCNCNDYKFVVFNPKNKIIMNGKGTVFPEQESIAFRHLGWKWDWIWSVTKNCNVRGTL